MQEKIITIYCLCADFLIADGHRDDPQTQMTTADVMTVALVAAEFFGGNQERSRIFLNEQGYMRQMLSKRVCKKCGIRPLAPNSGGTGRSSALCLPQNWGAGGAFCTHSKSRFNRRLHAIPDTLWQALFALLSETAKQSNPAQEYIVDSCPVPVCDLHQ